MWRRVMIALTLICAGSALAGVELATADGAGHRPSTAARAASGTSGMCGLRTNPGTYKHVIVIFDENNPYSSIYKSSSAPYINSVSNACGLATNYHNITHLSLPNYLGATNGGSLAQLDPYTSDCSPSSDCQWSGNNIFNQVNQKGLKWKSYAEDMPSNCSLANSGFYAPRHNPAVYNTDLSNCATNDVPLGTTSSSPLLKDFSSSTKAPAFSWITPNLCNDMHGVSGCPSSNLIQAGDNWLKLWLPKIISTSVYKAGQTVILLAWDEGEGGSATAGEDCATNTVDQSCHVVAIVVAPSVKKGKRVGTLLNHYSLLKSSEQLLGLGQLGQAKTATSMVKPFNL